VDAFTQECTDKCDDDILAFSAVVDDKGRLLVPAYVRKMLGISRNCVVSVVLERIYSVKTFRVESENDVEQVLDSIDNVISYKYESGLLEVAAGKGGRMK
jgi:bifunctional DNA-binding transcriptional regulator/antitoxin component of YhaV-PrlF toxin-antitoxin module